MASTVQNEISRIRSDEHARHKVEEAMKRQRALESGGLHKWVRLTNGSSNLHLLCKTDKDGNLLPKEIARINKVKKSLGIKNE